MKQCATRRAVLRSRRAAPGAHVPHATRQTSGIAGVASRRRRTRIGSRIDAGRAPLFQRPSECGEEASATRAPCRRPSPGAPPCSRARSRAAPRCAACRGCRVRARGAARSFWPYAARPAPRRAAGRALPPSASDRCGWRLRPPIVRPDALGASRRRPGEGGGRQCAEGGERRRRCRRSGLAVAASSSPPLLRRRGFSHVCPHARR